MFVDVQRAVEELKEGNLLIIVDDEDRENEGDFFIPAQICKPEHINFMARVGGGLVCVSMDKGRFDELQLNVPLENTSKFQTPFGYPIDYKEVTTGTSAYERALTANMVADITKKAEDFIKPGHLYTLKARQGGVLERAGHTEASVDLSKLAGFFPAGVICEIMDDDGSMARIDKLSEIAESYNIKILTVKSLIEYRLKREKLVVKLEERLVRTQFGSMKLHLFEDIYGRRHFVLENPTKNRRKYVRVHRYDPLSDGLGIVNENYLKKHKALQIISSKGGAFVYLDGAEGKPERAMDFRDYGIGAQIIRELGYEEIVPITSKPMNYKAIEGFGLKIVDFHILDL